jgi:hypothetical protein
MSRMASVTGGEGGIRTPGTGVSPYNGLANESLRSHSATLAMT